MEKTKEASNDLIRLWQGLPAIARRVMIIVVVAAAYAVASIYGQSFAKLPPGNVTAVFVASGIGLAATVLFGYWALPGVFLGSFIGNNNLYYPTPPTDYSTLAAIGIGVGAVLEAAAGAYLLKRFTKGDQYLKRVPSVAAFVVFAALASCMINATIGSTSIVYGLELPPAIHPGLWLTWWLGDAMGVLIFAPLLLLLPSTPRDWPVQKWVETAILLLIVPVVSVAVFYSGFPLEYLVIPLLVLVAFRLGLHGISVAVIAVSVIAVSATVSGASSFAVIGQQYQIDNFTLLVLLAFIGTVTAAMLLLSAVLYEEQQAQNALADTNASLELKVDERTRELVVAKDVAESATRLKSQFLATMSHELRTPMNAIIGYTEIQLAGMTGDLSDEQRDYQERVLANGRGLLTLINDILDISKIESGRIDIAKRLFDPKRLVDEVVYQTKGLMTEKQLKLTLNYDEALPARLVGDEDRLKQVLINLVSNAVKFTQQGEITIHARNSNADKWQLSVTDTGIGIPLHAQDLIFEEFRQVDGSEQRKHKGTGLGLAIVRKLVLLMGGRIEVKSKPNEGSTFTVTLPLVTEAPIQTVEGVMTHA
jgi:signal transduction histidine kinase